MILQIPSDAPLTLKVHSFQIKHAVLIKYNSYEDLMRKDIVFALKMFQGMDEIPRLMYQKIKKVFQIAAIIFCSKK